MSNDIVERIREVFSDTPEIIDMCDESYEGQEIASHIQGLYDAALEAASRIEQLEAALRGVLNADGVTDEIAKLARAALEGVKSDD